MKKLLSKEFIIGFCVILTLAILFFGIEFLKGVNVFKSANTYFVTFDNVTGLAQSAPVTINGYKVGLVRNLEYDPANPGKIKVEVSMDKDVRIPKGSTFDLKSELIGASTIVLNLAKSADYYQPGETIQGEIPEGMMDAVKNDVLPAVTLMMPKVDSLLTALTKLATDPNLASSISRLDRVMANLETSTKQLTVTMNSLQPIVRNTDQVAANLSKASSDLNELTTTLKGLPIEKTFNDLSNITGDVSKATAQLQNGNSSLGKLLYSDGLYNNLNKSTLSLDSLLVDVKKNPKRYINVKVF